MIRFTNKTTSQTSGVAESRPGNKAYWLSATLLLAQQRFEYHQPKKDQDYV